MYSLSPDDSRWLENFRDTVNARYPELVERMILFGSKARGDAKEDSDLDVLLVIREGDWRVKMKLADLACELALGTDTVPALMILTADEWQKQERSDSVFSEAVQKDGVFITTQLLPDAERFVEQMKQYLNAHAIDV